MPRRSSNPQGPLTKEDICGYLIELKNAVFPQLAIPAHFAKKAGLSNAVVMAILNKKNPPELSTIEKWTKACGKTLAQFFHDLTGDDFEDGVELKRGCEDFYRLLTVIFKAGYPAFVVGIQANLVGMAQSVNPTDQIVQQYVPILLARTLAAAEAVDGGPATKPKERPTSTRAAPGKKPQG